jgi:uncharacterized protein with von Willebrand factor type A (vWA) domain
LCLDCSGSMEGENWDNLVEIVKSFLEHRAKKSDDRISIILFSSFAKCVIENKSVKLIYQNLKIKP